MIKHVFLILVYLVSIPVSAQDKVLIAPFSIIDGDTFFIADVPEVEVLAFVNFQCKDIHI